MDLFNVIFKTLKMPHKWRLSTNIPPYKSKGNIQNSNNCRGIGLLRHTKKLMERVIEGTLMEDMRIA